MKRSIAVGLLLAATMAGIAQIADKAGSSSTLPASAPTTTRAAESEKVRDIRQLLELMHEREQIQIQLDSQLESLRQRLPNIPEESWRELAKELPADELLDMFVPLFEKHLSEEDVKAANKSHRQNRGNNRQCCQNQRRPDFVHRLNGHVEQ